MTSNNVTPINSRILTPADYREAELQFRRDLESRAVVLPSGGFVQGMPADGRWPRANAGNKNGTSGRGDAQYICNMFDGWPRWSIINYTDGLGFVSGYYLKTDRELTPDERAAVDRAIEENRRRNDEARAKQEREWEEVAEKCRERWANAQPADPQHAYLLRKAIKPYGVRQEGVRLLIPMYGKDGAIWSLQTINPDGFKMFAKGGRAGYCAFVIPAADAASAIAYVGEGYATCATIAELTSCGVVVAFDSGKLKTGVERAQREFPGKKIVVAADDDFLTPDNPGVAKAWDAAKEVGASVAVPDFTGTTRGDKDTDFNDMRRLKGDEAVRTALARATKGGGDNDASDTVPVQLPAVIKITKWQMKGKKRKDDSYTNAVLGLRGLGVRGRYDLFHDKKLVTLDDYEQPLTDAIGRAARERIIAVYGCDPGGGHVKTALESLCEQNRFDPVLDYLDGLKWDSKPRLDRWTTTYMGAKDTKLNQVTGKLVLIASVRRARKPGSKFDLIPILEGEEGYDKSTAIEALYGEENFSDQTIIALSDERVQERVQGVWGYEFADLTGMRKAEIEQAKAFVSRRFDRARGAYKHFREEPGRRCVFWGTTNDTNYLKSRTGNRRWLPIVVTRIRIADLRRDRDQLWAEAVVAEQKWEGSLALPKELWGDARVQQDARVEHDPWTDALNNVVGTQYGNEMRVLSKTLFRDVLHIGIGEATDGDMKRLSYCMRELGWSRPRQMRVEKDGVKDNGRGYSKPVQQADMLVQNTDDEG
jgi:predicted P-loop ATPase/phage/plasmid primase-like uncharacterized protein